MYLPLKVIIVNKVGSVTNAWIKRQPPCGCCMKGMGGSSPDIMDSCQGLKNFTGIDMIIVRKHWLSLTCA